MTPADVAAAVKAVESLQSDGEAAHLAEDRLYRELLQAIANGTCDDPGACARLALLTQGLDFSRWYA